VTSHPPASAEALTFRLRATELRALPGERYEIVLELVPKSQRHQPNQTGSGQQPEAVKDAS
jgi:hypothetical protein